MDGPGPDGSRRGWAAVWGAFAILLVGFGSAYSFGAFFAPLQHAFGASRGAVSFAFSAAIAVLFAVGPASGLLADRIGPRALASGGAALVGLGLVAASRADALWQVQLAFALGVGGGIGLAYVPSVAAVQKWFDRRRGLASGVAVAGIGAGTLAIPPLAAALIAGLGWRSAFLVIGAATAAVGGAAGLMVTAPGRGRGAASPAAARGGSGTDLARAVRSRPFALVFLGFVGASFGQYVPMAHLAPYAGDRGLPPETAALLLSALGAGSTIGRFAVGAAADRIGRRRGLAGTFAGLGAGCLLWLAADGALALGAVAFFIGACYGGSVALAPAVMADYFGARALSAVIGVLYSGVGLGALAGPALAGIAFDHWRSYTVAIAFSAAASALGAALVFSAEEPGRWRRRAGRGP